MKLVLVSVGVLVALASPCDAQTSGEADAPTPPALAGLYACTNVADNAARLACFDAAAATMLAAQADGSLVAVDRQQVEAVRRESFGFELPSIGSLLPSFNSDRDDGDQHVELQVDRLVRGPSDRTTFLMTDGQEWTQTETRSTHNVRPGDMVRIRRAALSGFMLVSPRGGAAHRVRRQR